MQLPRAVDPLEARILGALLEKSQTTPEYYPLTLRALQSACNQKNNREPVLDLGEDEIAGGLERLRRDALVWRTESARAERWKETLTHRLSLAPAERAIVTLLLLRGPQTPGELRSRSDRLFDFASLEDVERTLGRLAARTEPLVEELPRLPGRKERRWRHLFGTAETAIAERDDDERPAESVGRGHLESRVAALENRLEWLAAEVATLAKRLPPAGEP